MVESVLGLHNSRQRPKKVFRVHQHNQSTIWSCPAWFLGIFSKLHLYNLELKINLHHLVTEDTTLLCHWFMFHCQSLKMLATFIVFFMIMTLFFSPSLIVIQFSDSIQFFFYSYFLFNFCTSYKTSSVAFMDSSSHIKPMHYLMLEKHWQRI